MISVFIFSGCKKGGSNNGEDSQQAQMQQPQVEDITITEELLKKFIKTYPVFKKVATKVGQELQQSNNPQNASVGNEKIKKVLMENGWEDPKQFFSINIKIAKSLQWIMAQAVSKQMPAESRNLLNKQYADVIKKLSEDEKKLLIKYAPQIKKAWVN